MVRRAGGRLGQGRSATRSVYTRERRIPANSCSIETGADHQRNPRENIEERTHDEQPHASALSDSDHLQGYEKRQDHHDDPKRVLAVHHEWRDIPRELVRCQRRRQEARTRDVPHHEGHGEHTATQDVASRPRLPQRRTCGARDACNHEDGREARTSKRVQPNISDAAHFMANW